MATADAPGTEMLVEVGRAIRRQREHLAWTRRQLAEASGVSERFLAQLEVGDGNISLLRFADVARALGVAPSALLTEAETKPAARPIALLGMRGAGKSTIGAALAKRLHIPLVELDREIENAAGLKLAQIFELHGEAYYRRLQHDVLARLVSTRGKLVLATGGSIIQDDASYALLRARCVTVWLRATADDHWRRVVEQGDARPMAGSPHAFDELRVLLAAREPLYARADLTIDTSAATARQIAAELAERLAKP